MLRLKLLNLQFISYDRELYDALCSAPALKSAENKRKWPSPGYNEEVEEGDEGDDDDDDDDDFC